MLHRKDADGDPSRASVLSEGLRETHGRGLEEDGSDPGPGAAGPGEPVSYHRAPARS